MAKRYYESKGGGRENHAADKFNDEIRSQKDSMSVPGVRVGRTREEEYYAGHNDRRRLEMQDAGMIHEDHSAIANLPQGVMIKPYPRTDYYSPDGLDDSITGVDRQMAYDGKQKNAHMYPKKV